jgi:hypothetical protein
MLVTLEASSAPVESSSGAEERKVINRKGDVVERERERERERREKKRSEKEPMSRPEYKGR